MLPKDGTFFSMSNQYLSTSKATNSRYTPLHQMAPTGGKAKRDLLSIVTTVSATRTSKLLSLETLCSCEDSALILSPFFLVYSTIDGSPTRSIHYLSCIRSITPGPSPTPPPPTPDNSRTSSERAQQWLNAHNERRATLHTSWVSWDSGIANSAQNYASKLGAIDGCVIQHGYQEDSFGGENLAANWGRSANSQSPDEVLTRWFENEANLTWPANAHWSQVGWRATQYIGCGEVEKSYQGGTCFIQVCRYITPGNCNVGSAPLNELMLRETSPCSPQSP